MDPMLLFCTKTTLYLHLCFAFRNKREHMGVQNVIPVVQKCELSSKCELNKRRIITVQDVSYYTVLLTPHEDMMIYTDTMKHPTFDKQSMSMHPGYPYLSILSQLVFLPAQGQAFYPTTSIVWNFAPSPWQVPLSHDQNTGYSSWFRRSSINTVLSLTPQASSSTTSPPKVKIGIIGGGIAGVSAAHALAQRFGPSCEITVLEGDPQAGNSKHNANTSSSRRPQWIAATARNANSLAPAASMHVFSRQSVIWQVLSDSFREWYYLQKERIQKAIPLPTVIPASALIPLRGEDFVYAPPYFALHLIRCLGPSASSVERYSFIRFLSHFLYASLWLGTSAADERGRQMLLLAQANRETYLTEVVSNHDDLLSPDIGHSKGFLSVHRSLDAAEAAVKEAHEYGEDAELVDWERAVKLEPHLENLPMKPLYAVRRPNDYTASCEAFTRQWIKECVDLGVHYKRGKVDSLDVIPVPQAKADAKKTRFRVTTDEGSSHEFDILVLAAGVQTPLMAEQLGVGAFCPTYPMRGFSLTLFAWQQRPDDKKENLLHQPFSLDSMYCSSVTPWMARFAGFGEFVGYPEKAKTVPSMGPTVLSRYGKTIFPDAVNVAPEDVLPCFRPCSPDDLPIVGEVSAMPGLFIHTGHGTLGWTTGLATGDCVAQAVVDSLEGRNSKDRSFVLANNKRIDRRILSPNRFVG